MQPTPPASGEQPSIAGICGLAGGWSYPYCVATTSRGLLPLVFTLTPLGAVVFCYDLPEVASDCDFHRALLYPVRTFLPQQRGRQSDPPCGKVSNIFVKFAYICGALLTNAWGCLRAEIIPFSPDQDNACEGKAGLSYYPPAIKIISNEKVVFILRGYFYIYSILP